MKERKGKGWDKENTVKGKRTKKNCKLKKEESVKKKRGKCKEKEKE